MPAGLVSKNMETIYWTCGGVANMVNIIVVRLVTLVSINHLNWFMMVMNIK